MRVHASSGTHGKPTVVGYTRADLENWTELMARSMTMAGVRPGMLIHNANGYGLFTGGLGFHQGGERIGATVVPVSGGFTARQALLLRDLGAHVLVATPSYSLVIAQALEDAGVDPATLNLELGLFGGEPWTEGLRTQIDRALGLKAINFYGLSEMCGPGVASECLSARDGLHVQEDHFLVEVIDPAQGTRVPPGTDGELVFTTLTKEALPLIRYRTGDLGAITVEPCACGRSTARLIRMGGRRDDMMIIRGVNLYPSLVEQIILGADGVGPHYRLILERPGPMDELTLECEPAAAVGDRDALRRPARADAKGGDRGADRGVRGRPRGDPSQRGQGRPRSRPALIAAVVDRLPAGRRPATSAVGPRLRGGAVLQRPVAHVARRHPERALEHAREVSRVAEPPAERDVGHRAAVGALEVLEAARQPLAAHEPRHRRVDVLEQRVQRPHRDRIRARDRRRPEVGVLEMVPRIAPDLGSHRLARGGAARGHARLNRRAQQFERGVRGRDPGRGLELVAARAASAFISERATAPGRCRRAAAVRRSSASRGHTASTRARGNSSVRLWNASTISTSVGCCPSQSTMSPGDSASVREPSLTVSIPLHTSWKPRMSSCLAVRAHHGEASVTEKRRGGAVDQHQVADRPPGHRAAGSHPGSRGRRESRTRGASRPGCPTTNRVAV